MDELFLQLCAGVVVALEILKPTIKSTLNITDTNKPLYQASVWLIAALVGIAGAFAFQVDVTPAWIGLPAFGGFVFTGIIAAFGSEVGHRLLEVIEAVGMIFQSKAEASKVKG